MSSMIRKESLQLPGGWQTDDGKQMQVDKLICLEM